MRTGPKLPPGILDEINGGDSREWKAAHNLKGGLKGRKQQRKEQRQAKKHGQNVQHNQRRPQQGSNYRENLQKDGRNASGIHAGSKISEPPLKRAKHAQADKQVRAIDPLTGRQEMTASETMAALMAKKSNKVANKPEQPKSKPRFDPEKFLSERDHGGSKDEDDAKYYAKKLGLKTLKMDKEEDGLGDLLGDLDFDNFEGSDSDSDSDSESSDADLKLDRSNETNKYLSGKERASLTSNRESEEDSIENPWLEDSRTVTTSQSGKLGKASDSENDLEDTSDEAAIENPWSDDDSLSEGDFTDNTDLDEPSGADVGAKSHKNPQADVVSESDADSDIDSVESDEDHHVENPFSDDDSLSEGDFTDNTDLDEPSKAYDGLSESDGEPDFGPEMSVEETMAALKAAKSIPPGAAKLKKSARLRNSGLNSESDSDSPSYASANEAESDLDSSEEDFGPEMSVEETMAALKAAKAKGTSKPLEEPKSSSSKTKKPENPFLPAAGKYVTPARRRLMEQQTGSEVSEEDAKLARQIKGLLNKLTEDNFGVMVNEIEALFSSHSRQLVGSTLTSVILESVGLQGALQESFVIAYAGLVTALHRATGVDFGALFTQTLVEEFFKTYSPDVRDKKAANLLSLLTETYSMHLISHKLLYDLMRKFAEQVTEANTELLLQIVRNSGPQLRSDDPQSLKEIILTIQSAVNKLGAANVSKRIAFLIDSINSLKNNRHKPASEVAQASRQRLRKFLGQLKGLSSDPLQVTLDDIQNVETRGKWWLVGAAWRNEGTTASADFDKAEVDNILDTAEINWVELAKRQRLNTDIRRAIFVAIMGAEDYMDAVQRLDKLRLKNKQEREIPFVVLLCCSQEEVYNPYYALVAGKEVAKHSIRKSFQFALWDFLSKLDESEDKADVKRVMHYARFYASLVSQGVMSLDLLKPIDFLTANEDVRVFVDVLLVSLFAKMAKDGEVSGSRNILGQESRNARGLAKVLSDTKDKNVLRGIKHVLPRLAEMPIANENKKVRTRIQWAVELAGEMIEQLASQVKDKEDDMPF